MSLASNVSNISLNKAGRRLAVYLKRYATLAALFVLLVYFSCASPYFLTVGNFLSIFTEWSILGVLAVGFTFVVAAGEFDLSFGYLIALCSIAVALMLNAGLNIIIVILLTLAIGILVGLLNGFLVVGVGLPAFIATIGMGAIVQGTNYVFSGASPIPISYGILPDAYAFIGQGAFLGIPAIMLVFIPIAALSIYLLTKTRIGRHLYAIGTNLSAAKKAGINIKAGKVFAFVCTAISAAIVGILITSRSGSGQSIAGPEYLLDVFSAVFLGMSLFKQGEANAEGSLVGAFFMVVLSNGLTLLNMPFYILKVFQGLVILMGIGIASSCQSE